MIKFTTFIYFLIRVSISIAIVFLYLNPSFAQSDESKILYAPGEIIIKYEKIGKETKGAEILTEHQNVLEKLKVAFMGSKIKNYSPVFKNIVNEIIDQNLTESQLFNYKKMSKGFNINSSIINKTSFSNVLLLKIDEVGEDLEELAASINANSGLLLSDGIKIIYAEPNYLKRTTSNDPLYNQQWSHQVTHIEQAWGVTQGNTNVKIAIIDTGVDPTHPDLNNNLLPGYDFVDIDTNYYKSFSNVKLIPEEDYTEPDNDCTDYNGHGTHVAGITAAVGDNGIGIKGVAPNCKILPVRAGFSLFIGEQDYGFFETTSIVNAINYAVDNGANIISMSFGGSRSNLEEEVIKYAAYRNVVLIAAAGNSETSLKQYPAGYDEVLAITSIDKNRETSYFSNFGVWTDIAAPGEEIISTVPFTGGVISDPSGYRKLSGTSMAAPYVAGVAALLISNNPGIMNNLVYQYLRTSVTPVSSAKNDFYYIGTGIIDAYQVVSVKKDCIAKITSPNNIDHIFVINEELAISGRANGSQFKSYTFDYANYIYDSKIKGGHPNWQRLGGIYSVPVDSGYLGTIRITQPGIYWLRLRIFSLSNVEYTDIIGPIIVDKKMKTDWMVSTGFSSLSSPAVSDIDKDGNPETIFTSSDGRIYVLDKNGNSKPGWPVLLPNPNPPYNYTNASVGSCSPSIADINNDGKEEVIVRDGHYVHVYSHEGQIMPGWPKSLENYLQGNSLISSPVVVDIDNDGEKEIIVTYAASKIKVFKNNGNIMPGWPVVIPLDWVFSTLFSTPAVSDLDGDGEYEIIVQCYDDIIKKGFIYVFDKTGSILPGWPQQTGIGSRASPIAVDINNDGYNEIIVSSLLSSENNETGIFAFNKSGELLNGWPVVLNTHSTGSGISAGDINNDGFKEIVVGSNDSRMALWAIDRTGKIRWNIRAGTGDYIDRGSTPLIVDINGDNIPEILISRYRMENSLGSILIVSNTGQIMQYPKFLIPEMIFSTPTIADMDNDNQLELSLATGKGNIFFWDIDSPNDPSKLIWPTFQFNNQRTGSIEPPRIPLVAQLVEPLNNVIKQPIKITFKWNYSARATSYKLQISDIPSFENILREDSSLTGISYTIDSLESNKKYYWRVNAKNSVGTSNWSDVWSFATKLSTPTLALPSNNSIGTSLSPTLSWSSVTGADKYRLEVNTKSDFTGTIIYDKDTISTTIKQMGGLLDNTIYYWRITAFNNSGNSSDISSTFSFTTGQTVLTSVSNGAIAVSISPTLSWTKTLGANKYRLEVNTKTDFTGVVVFDNATITDTLQTVSGLAYNTTYYWRVTASSNALAKTTTSTIYSFTTKLSTPTLALPSNDSIGISLSPTLSWSSVTGADKYRLEVNTKTDFTGTIIYDKDTISTTTKQIGGLSDTTEYYWRVTALNNSGNLSDISSTFCFTTIGMESLKNVIPKDYNLMQNYPNPFNPGTTIKYDLPKSSYVKIQVFDVLGKEIEILEEGYKHAGFYEIEFDGSKYSSGVYIYTINNSEKVLSKKMLLLK